MYIYMYVYMYIVYVIESAAYGVICTSCLCQTPERASEGFDTNNFITRNTRIFIEIVL